MENQSCKTNRWRQLKAQLNNLAPHAFAAMIEQHPQAILIDVRTAGEQVTGALPGAIPLDYLAYDFIDRLEELDPQATYLVYCRSGRRSIRACTLMKNSGFTQVYNLDGGLNLWPETLASKLSPTSKDF